MVVAARGESLSDPRKERVRFHPEPRFWGTYWLWPLSAVLRIRNPLARPSSVFITTRPLEYIGIRIHQCRGPALHCTVSQSVSQSVLNRSGHLRAPLPQDHPTPAARFKRWSSRLPLPELPVRAEEPGV